MTTLNAYYRDRELDARLFGAWRRQQFCHLVYGAGCAMAVAGSIALFALALDWLIDLPGIVRSGVLAALVATGLWQGHKRGWRFMRRFRPRHVGLEVERAYPTLNSLLVCYVDFAHGQDEAGTSAQLRRHTCQRAVAESRALHFDRIAPHRQMKQGLTANTAVIVVFGLLSLLFPQFMWVFAQRLVNPLSTAAYPTDTVIVMVSGDQNVAEGASVTLRAKVNGVMPKRSTLRVRSEGGNWERIELTAQPAAIHDDAAPDAGDTLDRSAQGSGAEADTFSYRFSQVHRGFEYQFLLGDARSDAFVVTVVAAPRVTSATVVIEPPTYTGLAAFEQHALTISAPEGAAVRWTLQLDRAVTDAQFRADGDDPITMTTSRDGRTVDVQTTASASGSYSFAWKGKSHGFAYLGPQHHLQVIADHEPRVRIDYPSEDEKATLAKTLSVTFSARDDHGVAEATLVHWRNEAGAVRAPLGTLAAATNVEHTITFPLKELVAGLSEGDIVSYYIEVADRYPGAGGPHRASSDTRRVQVLSIPEYMAYMQRQQALLIGQLRPVYRQERLASENVRQMKDDKP
ncbi:MAG: DUF4175 family protein [Phycisphaeraceae bacterium]